MTENLLTNEIPEKFKDPETGGLKADALLRSYKELEKKLSQGGGAPKSPEDYCIDCSHGMFEPDVEVNARMHAKGFSHEQAQELYNLAAEKMMPLIAEIAAEFQADREVERLINHFGGLEKWKEVSRQLLAFGRQNVSPDVLKNLSGSYEGVLALHRMMKSEEPGLKRGVSVTAIEEKDLHSMMRDPRYWRDKDPSFIAKVTDGFQKIYGNKN
ncbi:MAG: hypothetical protein DYH13_06950 [Alphaproteobacteria bacterium PRO2]|nr:hypothetical protein [Alphaproteobacteria bacterium PRO2]